MLCFDVPNIWSQNFKRGGVLEVAESRLLHLNVQKFDWRSKCVHVRLLGRDKLQGLRVVNFHDLRDLAAVGLPVVLHVRAAYELLDCNNQSDLRLESHQGTGPAIP